MRGEQVKRFAFGAILIALAVPATIQAQNLEFIFQVGASLGSYSGDDISSSTDVGGVAGAKVRVGGAFYIDGGIFWGANGGRIESETTTDDFGTTGVRFPVTLGVRLIRARIIDVRFYGGGVFDVISSVSDNDFGFVKDDLKSSVFSGKVGAGVDIAILAVDLAYEFGLSDVFESSAALGGVKRNAWVAEVGLRFGF